MRYVKRVMYRRGTGHLTLQLCRISENFRKPKKYRAF